MYGTGTGIGIGTGTGRGCEHIIGRLWVHRHSPFSIDPLAP